MPDVRGAPKAIPFAMPNIVGDHQAYKMVGFNTLAKSFYEAFRREPQNEQVLATLRRGLPGAIILNPK
eukprot:11871830-Alexandrium_andersonii.AAC.1